MPPDRRDGPIRSLVVDWIDALIDWLNIDPWMWGNIEVEVCEARDAAGRATLLWACLTPVWAAAAALCAADGEYLVAAAFAVFAASCGCFALSQYRLARVIDRAMKALSCADRARAGRQARPSAPERGRVRAPETD